MVNSERLGFIAGLILVNDSQNEKRRAFDRPPKSGSNPMKINVFLRPLNGI